MRSAFIAAALAASAFAAPRINKREDVDVAYVTDIVTMTVHKAPYSTQVVSSGNGGDFGDFGSDFGGYDFGNGDDGYGSSSGGDNSGSQPPSMSPVASAPMPSSYQPSAASSQPQPQRSSYTPPASSASSAAPSSASSAPASSSAPSNDGSYKGKCLSAHNVHRANHSAPDIQWDDGLASTAAKIAATCNYAHNTEMDGGGYGQNIAAGIKPEHVDAVITNLFYNSEVSAFDGNYGQANPSSNFESWGHFTQVVWKASGQVGCATQDCSSQGLANAGGGVPAFFTVCNYKSPGNFAGEYDKNVGRPLGHPTVTADEGLGQY